MMTLQYPKPRKNKTNKINPCPELENSVTKADCIRHLCHVPGATWTNALVSLLPSSFNTCRSFLVHVGEDVEQEEHFSTVGGNADWYNHYGKHQLIKSERNLSPMTISESDANTELRTGVEIWMTALTPGRAFSFKPDDDLSSISETPVVERENQLITSAIVSAPHPVAMDISGLSLFNNQTIHLLECTMYNISTERDASLLSREQHAMAHSNSKTSPNGLNKRAFYYLGLMAYQYLYILLLMAAAGSILSVLPFSFLISS
ncbi:hypothetical protein STEG23_038108 [Scotinomys teguina]